MTWLAERRCADGAVITATMQDGGVIHVDCDRCKIGEAVAPYQLATVLDDHHGWHEQGGRRAVRR